MAVWRLWILCGVALLAVKSVPGCELGSVDVLEDSDRSFTCNVYTNSILQWKVYNEKRETIFSSSCYEGRCTPWSDKLFQIYFDMWVDYYKYTLKIKSITRNSARTLSCNNSSTHRQCELRIIVKPVYTKGSCSVWISNWMVIGSCTVKKMYSSDNNYSCKWSESENNEEFGGFQTTLTSYTAQNQRSYTKGVCSFAKPMPFFKRCYTYSMSVSPGAINYFNETICIDTPYQAKLSHNCPEYVFEGSNVHCECNASRPVSPPALVVWEGMNDSTLLLTNVSRGWSQGQFTCRLEWSPDGSIKENTSYKVNVAYGPSDVLITEITTDEAETRSLTCTATDVYPSAEFRWNVTCSNRTDYGNSSTCSLNFTQNGESLAILCTASNTHFHRQYISRVYVLSSVENKQAITGRPNAGLIGGVISAVLIVLIIIAALIVFIIKWRKGILDRERSFLGIFSDVRKRFDQEPDLPKPHSVVNKPLTQMPIKRQAAPSGDIYTITNTTISGHVVYDYASVFKTANSNIAGTENDRCHHMTPVSQETVAFKPTTTQKPTTTNITNVQDLHGTGYMNFTEVPTDSGLGIYHVVPWATMSGSTVPYTSEYFIPTISEEDYNELHFEEGRTGQEDHADNYHHLQIT